MFRKAERKQAKLRLALCGVSGSGKTYSAIKIAKGIGGRIALIDTENGSGDLYCHLADYDIAPLFAPFAPEKYIEIIKRAEKEGYQVLIIDSLSHAWAGAGGILDMHDKATAGSKSQNSYMAWRYVTPIHNLLVETMLQSKLHIIVTMRTKAAYQMVEERGKQKPVKMGLAPIQREGMDYEFTVVLDIAVDSHIASVSKDRTELFDGKFFQIDEKTGEKLLEWLNTGVSLSQEADKAIAEMKSAGTLEALSTVFTNLKNCHFWGDAELKLKVINEKDIKKMELQHKLNEKNMKDEFLAEEEKEKPRVNGAHNSPAFTAVMLDGTLVPYDVDITGRTNHATA